MLRFLTGLSPKVVGGLLIALVVSVSATGALGYMLLQSHAKRGELSQALTDQKTKTKQAIAALDAEREAWEQSLDVYRDGLVEIPKRVEKLRESMNDETNDPVPDRVIDRLPR